MTTTTYSNSAAHQDTLTWSSSSQVPALSALSWSAPSDPIDNTTGATSYTRGFLRLVFTTPQTLIDNPPTRLTLVALPLFDGTNLPTPPGALAIRPQSGVDRVDIQMLSGSDAGGTYSVVDFSKEGVPFRFGPFKYAFQLFNGTPNPWTGVITATLYRWNIVNG